jgi:hypothetical protein
VDEQEEEQRECQRTRVVKPDRRLPTEGIRQPSQYEIARDRAAEAAGIDAAPLTPFAMVPRDAGGLTLGYAIAKPAEIRAGIEVLARCLSKPQYRRRDRDQ